MSPHLPATPAAELAFELESLRPVLMRFALLQLHMRLHLIACDACRTLNNQMTLLRKARRALPSVYTTEVKEK